MKPFWVIASKPLATIKASELNTLLSIKQIGIERSGELLWASFAESVVIHVFCGPPHF